MLIAEDEPDIALTYRIVLEKQGHKVTLTGNGEDCVAVYASEAQKAEVERNADEPLRVFDVVLLDYRMPKMDGMDVAREILALNPQQRIVFASAYVKETLMDSIKELKQAVELVQKPFDAGRLVSTVEDEEIYDELKKMGVSIKAIKAVNPTHDQIESLLDGLKKLQKYRTL
ncbi:MAG TPA: response regulator [Nitrososphaera sp.]|nr:response regulator [Nitrososphaera sp.]HEX2614590.1 response regulator [Nitrososphaera sp.]